MTIRRSSNSSIVEVQTQGQKIEVQVALNHEHQPRAILGRCSTPGREKYFVWATRNSCSRKPHLTCRVTGWQEDGNQQTPPQGTSVRLEDVRLDPRFDGLRKADVVAVICEALGIYESASIPISDQRRPSTSSIESEEMKVEEEKAALSLLMMRDMEDLKRRVTELEERERARMQSSHTLASPVSLPDSPTWPTSNSHLLQPSAYQTHEHDRPPHFLSTVLCVPEDRRSLATQTSWQRTYASQPNL